MVLLQYELVPKLEFVSYYYQLVLVRYTCIECMRFRNQIMNKYHIIACKL